MIEETSLREPVIVQISRRGRQLRTNRFFLCSFDFGGGTAS